MQNNTSDELLMAQPLMTLRIIWTALFCSQILYYYVANLTSKNFEVESTLLDTSDPMTLPFIVMGILGIAAAAYLPKVLSKNSSVDPRRPVPAPAENNPIASFKRYVTPFIIRLALLESVALYGFVLAILHHDPKRMLLFVLASMLGFIFSFPNAEKVRAGFSP